MRMEFGGDDLYFLKFYLKNMLDNGFVDPSIKTSSLNTCHKSAYWVVNRFPTKSSHNFPSSLSPTVYEQVQHKTHHLTPSSWYPYSVRVQRRKFYSSMPDVYVLNSCVRLLSYWWTLKRKGCKESSIFFENYFYTYIFYLHFPYEEGITVYTRIACRYTFYQ